MEEYIKIAGFFITLIVSNCVFAGEGSSCPEGKDSGELICFNGTLQNPCNTGSGYGSAICSERELKKADIELNKLYQIVLTKIEPDSSERKPKTSFIQAQVKWVAWRDAICNYEKEANSGNGSWQTTTKNSCLVRITEARSRALQQYIECFEVGGTQACTFQHSISKG